MSKEKSVFFQKYFVTDKAFYKKVLLILIPVVLQSCINQGVNMMDTIMVGQLGDTAIAASSQANQFYSLFQIFCMGLSAAGLVLTAQYFGAKDLHTVRRVRKSPMSSPWAPSTCGSPPLSSSPTASPW